MNENRGPSNNPPVFVAALGLSLSFWAVCTWVVQLLQGDLRALIMVGIMGAWLGWLSFWLLRPRTSRWLVLLSVVGLIPLLLQPLWVPIKSVMLPAFTHAAVLAMTAWLPAVQTTKYGAIWSVRRQRDAFARTSLKWGVTAVAGSALVWLVAWRDEGPIVGVAILASLVWLGWLTVWRRAARLGRPISPWIAAAALPPITALVWVILQGINPNGLVAFSASLSLAGMAATWLLSTGILGRPWPRSVDITDADADWSVPRR
ncbi:MAG: hypothetical protein L0G99_14870 [Propionibacteriales bacterium]|nr:hypothetical protein [Propionibacteriales bacterium]